MANPAQRNLLRKLAVYSGKGLATHKLRRMVDEYPFDLDVEQLQRDTTLDTEDLKVGLQVLLKLLSKGTEMDKTPFSARYAPQAVEAPRCSPPMAGRQPTAAECAEALARAEQREAEAAELAAISERLTHEQRLADATLMLLNAISGVVLSKSNVVTPTSVFAQFRKELDPLANTYGLKIVLVGDKTTATLRLI